MASPHGARLQVVDEAGRKTLRFHSFRQQLQRIENSVVHSLSRSALEAQDHLLPVRRVWP
jgi:hypothetical protein